MKALRAVLAGATGLALATLAPPTGASAQTIRVGVSVSTTGPAASLGIPEANTAKLMPREIGGHPVEYVVLDDATDTTKGVANMRKLVTDDRVDAVIGSSVTPVSLAMVEVANETGTPVISLAASEAIVAPVEGAKRWAFKTPQNDSLMAEAVVDHMAANGVKSVGFIGFNDAYGEGWLKVLTASLEKRKIPLVASERYARTDTGVTGQVLKLLAARPDAVLVGAAGTPAALPQKTLKERGFAGKIYQTHGAANNDFLRVGGKDVEGTILPAGPVLVAAQLPDSNPVKAAGLDYVKRYEAANGTGSVSTFGAHANDASVLLSAALPVALKSAKPGTAEFRSALRDAIENAKDVVYSQGIVNMSATDHVGQDKRARVLVTIENGSWKLLPEGGM